MTLTIRGVPGPKGSRSTNRHGASYEQSQVAVQWMKDVELQARAVIGSQMPLPPPYEVAISFAMPRPANPSYEWPTRGDLDKLERATLDGLQKAGVILEDKHVTALASDKQFASGQTGAVIHVRSIS